MPIWHRHARKGRFGMVFEQKNKNGEGDGVRTVVFTGKIH